jgi:pilus assembly protein Flp/PilA
MKNGQGEKAMKKLMAFFKEDEGAGMVEYGLLVALIAIGLIATLGSVRQGLITLFTKIVNALTTA